MFVTLLCFEIDRDAEFFNSKHKLLFISGTVTWGISGKPVIFIVKEIQPFWGMDS